MTEDADSKAKRRRRIRESFLPPLNEIALRHVDSVQALTELQKEFLAKALQKIGVKYLADCLVVIKNSDMAIEDEDQLVKWVTSSDTSQADNLNESNVLSDKSADDEDYLAELLIKCYPDMPPSSAEALVASEVMSRALGVVTATRQALEDAKSDFVITALYTLFEERLHRIAQIISNNPAFIKTIQRSRSDWNTKN